MNCFVLSPESGARERMAVAWKFARQFLALGI